MADDANLLSAIILSEQAVARGNYPFAAILVDASGSFLFHAENTELSLPLRDCTAHAEINVLRDASTKLDAKQLAACTLYVSSEPCVMCAGAIYWANLGRIVYGLGAEQMNAMYPSVVPAYGCREVFSRCEFAIEVCGPHRELEASKAHELFLTKA